jgi:hypothetical protein
MRSQRITTQLAIRLVLDAAAGASNVLLELEYRLLKIIALEIILADTERPST